MSEYLTRLSATVAEAEGYRHLKFTREDGSSFVFFFSPSSIADAIRRGTGNPVVVQSGGNLVDSPAYATDLNLIHEATLRSVRAGDFDRHSFTTELERVCRKDESNWLEFGTQWYVSTANAEQRCRAYLMAKGLDLPIDAAKGGR